MSKSKRRSPTNAGFGVFRCARCPETWLNYNDFLDHDCRPAHPDPTTTTRSYVLVIKPRRNVNQPKEGDAP